MKPSTISHIRRNKNLYLCAAFGVILLLIAAAGLFVGKYPVTLQGLLSRDRLQWRVFWTLRFTRVAVGVLGGFALGTTGFVYQTVFRNPLAAPDVIGVSSGASAGAAAGILFLSGAAMVTFSSFLGALLAVAVALALSMLDRTGKNSTIVLAGIAVHALAQTALMVLKLTADPEKQLSAIEYWIMGSLSGISMYSLGINMILCIICIIILFILHRQVILLSMEESEAGMLGVSVGKLRLLILIVATLAVASVISLTGLISFIGLLAPHTARLITKNNRMGTMFLGGILGGILLTGADILARSAASTELPVSIFTSLLGAPFLIYLMIQGSKAK